MSEVKTNKISSLTGTNNDITIDPDGTGNTVVASGNVGIGVSTVSGKLHLSESGAINQAATIFSLDDYDSTFGANLAKSSGTYTTPAANISGGGWEYQPVNSLNNHGAMIYLSAPDTNSSAATPLERLRIDGSGNLTLSSGILQAIGVYNNTTGSGANVVVDSGGGFARSTSSQRYKNTIADATHGLSELLTLRPVTYKHNNSGDTVFGGLIAEEVHAAGLTEFVQYSEDDNGDDQPEALDYANMVSLCIKAIQEQQSTITALEARITALEAE